MYKESAQTSSRDEMIALGRRFANKAREVFKADPSKCHVISLGADPSSGKSLIVDTIKTELFREGQVPPPKERVISHYDGEIDGSPATISLINAKGYCSYDLYNEAMIAAGRLTRSQHPGFMFILNRPTRNLGQVVPLFPLPEELMNIQIRYTDAERAALGFKWLGFTYLGIKKFGPRSWDRDITYSGPSLEQ